MEWKIIIIILVLIALLFYFCTKKKDYYKDDPVEKYENIRDKMKTGDIILFSSREPGSLYKSFEYYMRTNFIGSEYGHVGLIIRNKNKLYVLECTTQDHCADKYSYYFNNFKKGGIRITKLETMLREYQKINTAFFGVKFIAKEIPLRQVEHNINKYLDVTFPKKNLLFMLGFCDILVSHELAISLAYRQNKDQMMCSEFVYQLLYDCGIVKYYPSKLFWPHLFNSQSFDDLQIISYSKPFKFTI